MYRMTIDTSTAVRAFEAVLKQFPFATSQALNDVALEFRAAQREHMDEVFKIRRPWVLTGVQIPRGGYAKKDRLQVDVVVDDKRDFLWKFENEIEYEPRSGRFAVPVDVPRTGKGVIKKNFRPAALELTQNLPSDPRYRGKRRSFVIEDAGGVGGIFRRVGRGSTSKIELLYWFRKKTPIDPELDFRENARRIFEESFANHYNKRILAAFRSARISAR